MVNENLVKHVVKEPYKYGFVTDIETEKIEKGQRLFQIVAPNCSNIEYTIKDNLSNSSRGKGGFGSTGK